MEVNAVSGLVGKDLNFDVARLFDEFFDKDAVVAECRAGFVLRADKAIFDFIHGPSDPHAFAAATGRGFEHHRAADLACDF